MNEIKDVSMQTQSKQFCFMKGAWSMNGDNIGRLDNDFAKALMIEPKMIDDPYVQNCIYQMIKNRINEARSVFSSHGNYSIVCGDPFSLCQHIFGLEVTGLLKTGEIYNATGVNRLQINWLVSERQ